MSASWLACTLTLDRWVPKWTPFFTLFWALTDRYLRAWKPVPSCLQFDQQRVLSRFFSLPPPPSPSFQQLPSPPTWRNEKPQLRSWELEPNPTAIKEGRTERKTALETTGSTIRRLRGIKFGVRPLRVVRDQCLSAHANFDTDMLHTRWTLLEMRKDALQRGLPAPDEAYAKHHCLH